jgi:isopropylmalate/homocitrate/citramalate synthase
MTNTPWSTDQWFVSPWNYMPEVTRDWQFPDEIKVHDLTLRDGEQQAGLALRKEEKVRLAESMAEMGVQRIEAGIPVVSDEDAAAIKEIVRRDLGPDIFALARCRVSDVQRVVDTGVKHAIVEIPCSEHMLEYAYKWPLERAIELSVEATRYAHEQGLYVVFFPIDSTRTEMNWYLDLIQQVADNGHMDALALVDTAGVLSPHSIPYLVKATRERIHKPLEAHFHNDFGVGVANTIAALASGVSVAHLTSLGIGERAGNTPLEETVMALKLLYGQDLGIKTEHFREHSLLVRELTGVTEPSNRPIVGDTLFTMEAGIITDWYRNVGEEHFLEVFPFVPELVGQDQEDVILGKKSGAASVDIWLEKIGADADQEERTEILNRVKQLGIQKKGPLNELEFRAIVDEVVNS